MSEDSARVKELSQKLQDAEEALLRSARLEVASRYAGAIMHEVSNSLEALTNLVFLSKMQAGTPDAVAGYMVTAEEQLKRLGEITRKTLSFFRDRAEATEVDLVELAESALALHAAGARQRKVEIRKTLEGPAVAKAIAGEMLQVFSNLILNAIEAAVGEDAVLCLRVKRRGAKVIIAVSDNGPGIEARIYDHLFAGLRSTKSQGTGLGLWLSHNIVRKHGGRIVCRTSRPPGRTGTTFRLVFPAV